jgi:hypothetical protein
MSKAQRPVRWFGQRPALVLACPRTDTIRLWPLPLEPPHPRGLGRIRRVLQPRESAPACTDVVGGESGWPLAALHLRGVDGPGQGESGHLLAAGRESRGDGEPARAGYPRRRDRGGLGSSAGAIPVDCGRFEGVGEDLTSAAVLCRPHRSTLGMIGRRCVDEYELRVRYIERL